MKLRVARKVLRRQKACESLAAFDGRELTWDSLGDHPRPYREATLEAAQRRQARARGTMRRRTRAEMEERASASLRATAGPALATYSYLARLLGVAVPLDAATLGFGVI